ncbi:unnamed protein product, partial [Rhizoctonia solani]
GLHVASERFEFFRSVPRLDINVQAHLGKGGTHFAFTLMPPTGYSHEKNGMSDDPHSTPSPSQIITLLNSTVDGVYNQHLLIHRLPTEVLSMIFRTITQVETCALDPHDTISYTLALGAVCTYWRRIINNSIVLGALQREPYQCLGVLTQRSSLEDRRNASSTHTPNPLFICILEKS